MRKEGCLRPLFGKVSVVSAAAATLKKQLRLARSHAGLGSACILVGLISALRRFRLLNARATRFELSMEISSR